MVLNVAQDWQAQKVLTTTPADRFVYALQLACSGLSMQSPAAAK